MQTNLRFLLPRLLLLFRLVLILVVVLGFTSGATASLLAQPIQQFPQWQNKPPNSISHQLSVISYQVSNSSN